MMPSGVGLSTKWAKWTSVGVINNLRRGQSWEKDGSRILWAGLTKIKGTMNSRTSKKEFIKTPGQRVKEICICFVY